jgi:predicted TIM-barrel enzyme
MKRIAWFAAATTLVAGCATIDYVGENYAPTTHVDTYYSEANVTRAYTVMGEVVATGDQIVSTSKMQDQIREEAMKRGADAVIITGLERYASGENTSWSENETTKKDKKGRDKTTTFGSSNTSVEEKKQIKAVFIRYKPATESTETAKNP